MKLSKEYSIEIRKKITEIQHHIDELETMINVVDDITDYDRHDIKAINKLKGWLINLKADVKRAAK